MRGLLNETEDPTNTRYDTVLFKVFIMTSARLLKVLIMNGLSRNKELQNLFVTTGASHDNIKKNQKFAITTGASRNKNLQKHKQELS